MTNRLILQKKSSYLYLFILTIIFLTLIANIYSFNYSYFDLGLFVESSRSKQDFLNERYYFLSFFNFVMSYEYNKKIFGILLIIAQFFAFLVSFLFFFFKKKNEYLNLLYLSNLNLSYSLFFDFHFEFVLILLILVFLQTRKNFIKFFIIFFLPFLKDTFLLISLGLFIYFVLTKKNGLKYILIQIFFVILMIFFIMKKYDLIFELFNHDFFDYQLLIKKILLVSIIILPFVIFLNKNFLINKIYIIVLPYLIFLFILPNDNYLKFYYHYQIPVTFVLFYSIFLTKINLTKIKKRIYFFIILFQITFSPLIGLPVSLLFKESHIYYKNILSTVNLNVFNNDLFNKSNKIYIQNNFYSPLIYNYFNSVNVIDKNLMFTNNEGALILLSKNKNFFVGDQKCQLINKILYKNNSTCDEIYNFLNSQTKVIFENENLLFLVIYK